MSSNNSFVLFGSEYAVQRGPMDRFCFLQVQFCVRRMGYRKTPN